MDGEWLLHILATLFAYCFRMLNFPLFTYAGHTVTLWKCALSFIMLKIFCDFLDILGIWGYCSDDDYEELIYEDRED